MGRCSKQGGRELAKPRMLYLDGQLTIAVVPGSPKGVLDLVRQGTGAHLPDKAFPQSQVEYLMG